MDHIDTLHLDCTLFKCLVLIDKDFKAKWKPSTYKEVTQTRLDWYFSHLPPSDELALPTDPLA